jgi:peptidoglycan/xylan/chitin deacetylase (PgdA/CDA1 family)
MFKSITRNTTQRMKVSGIFIGLCAMVIFSSGMPMHSAYAAVQGSSATPKISFTFDDGQQSALLNAEPILAQYGLVGTSYIITDCVGMTTVPNTCNANNDVAYMTWAQIKQLQTAGWEIGSHTADHDCLASSAETDPSDCANAAPLTNAQLTTELQGSQQALAAQGYNATDIAPPYGDYNNNVIAQLAKYYATMRQFKNDASNANVWPYSDYYLQDYVVLEKTTPVATIETAINNAITNKQWLILTFHDIEAKPSKTPDDYQFGTAELTQLAAYVQTKIQAAQLTDVTVNQGLVTSTTNLLPDSSFNDGISDGWSTDSPSTITADGGDNGSYPDPTNSVKLTSGTTTGHLFSPKVAVTPGTPYMYKSFLNMQNITAGSGNEIGYYIDEYDANGNWISGQWKTQETSSFVEDMNFAYTPSSSKVAYASLQLIVAPNAGITAYVDNFQMFPLTTTTTTSTDLVANGTFNDGISDGWSTDDSGNVVADGSNNGSPADPVNSIKLQSGTRTNNGHLFSPEVAVSSTNTYGITSWLNMKQIAANGDGVAFYIDEYNSAGSWISGQYKTGVNTLGVNNVGFTYTPSSSSVAKASLQVIVVSNAGVQAYLDDVNWMQQ